MSQDAWGRFGRDRDIIIDDALAFSAPQRVRYDGEEIKGVIGFSGEELTRVANKYAVSRTVDLLIGEHYSEERGGIRQSNIDQATENMFAQLKEYKLYKGARGTFTRQVNLALDRRQVPFVTRRVLTP